MKRKEDWTPADWLDYWLKKSRQADISFVSPLSFGIRSRYIPSLGDDMFQFRRMAQQEQYTREDANDILYSGHPSEWNLDLVKNAFGAYLAMGKAKWKYRVQACFEHSSYMPATVDESGRWRDFYGRWVARELLEATSIVVL
jgi:hypothetical protein